MLFAVFVGSVVLRGIFGRTLGSAFTAVGTGLLEWIAGYALLLALLAAAGAVLLAQLGRAARGCRGDGLPRVRGLRRYCQGAARRGGSGAGILAARCRVAA